MNVIIVYDKDEKNILMCVRSKNPYKGLYNFVGGKVEKGEKGIDSAYRELEEETKITKKDIILTHMMDFNYNMSNNQLQVYVGKLNKNVKLVEEINKLYWINVNDNFYDIKKYAGEGNIGYMITQVDIYRNKLFK